MLPLDVLTDRGAPDVAPGVLIVAPLNMTPVFPLRATPREPLPDVVAAAIEMVGSTVTVLVVAVSAKFLFVAPV